MLGHKFDLLYLRSVKHRMPAGLFLLLRTAGRLLVLAAMCSILGATVWWDNASNRGIDSPMTGTPLQWSNVPRGGVNTYALHLEVVTPAQRATNDNKVARTFQMIQDAGFHFVRVQFPWEDIEVCGKGQFHDDCRSSTKGQSTWTKYDYIVQQARAHGLELIVRIDRPPQWARTAALASPEVQAAERAGRSVMGPPDRIGDYVDIVRQVARRY